MVIGFITDILGKKLNYKKVTICKLLVFQAR